MPLVAKLGILAVVLVVVGGVAWYFLQGQSDGGTGAASPEEAVQNLATSLAEDDLIGVMAAMDPEEMAPVADVFELALRRAGELELLEVTETGLAELDLSVDDLQLTVEELHDDVARVQIEGGTLGADFTSPDLGVVLVGMDGVVSFEAEQMEGDTPLDEMYTNEEGEGLSDTFVMVVKRDGGWYVSPLYTMAEAIREGDELGDADFAASRGEVEGADSPVAAVEAFVAAAEGIDPEALVATLPPGEWGFARDYLQPLLDELDEDELDESREELDLKVEGLDLAEGEDLGDGRRKVELQGLQLSWTDEYDGDTEVTLEGRCAEIVTEEETTEGCLEDWFVEGELDPTLAELVPETLFVVAVEDEGGWYVSPMETLAAYLTFALERVDRDHLAAVGFVEPQPFTVGEPVDGELANPFRTAAYTFELTEGDPYLVQASSPDGGVEFSVHPAGADRWSEGGAAAEQYADGVPEPEPFFAAGTSYVGGVEGDTYELDASDADEPLPYTIAVTPIELDDTIGIGETIEVSLDEGEAVAYEFTAEADQVIIPELDGDASLSVLCLCGSSVYASIGIETTLYTGGDYLAVLSATGTGGDITFELAEPGAATLDEDPIIDPPETIDDIPELDVGPIERVSLGTDEIVDFLVVGTGGTLRIAASGADADMDPVMAVFNGDLELVAQSTGDATERRAVVEFESSEDELYVVSVSGYEGMAGDVRVRATEP
jgi:hypothetical protein